MKDPESISLDRELRAALEPQPAEVERLVARALRPDAPQRGRRWLPAAASLSALALVLVLAFAPRRSQPGAPARPAATIASVGGVLLVEVPGRPVWIGNDGDAVSPSPATPSLLIAWKEPAP